MKSCRQQTLRRGLASALAALWMVSVIVAGSAVAPPMACHGMAMPCCPPSGNNSAQCSGAQCIEQVPQKSEAAAPILIPQATLAPAIPAATRAAEPVRELTRGLHYEAQVFRLKDDLRI